jgi:hypothetical protein
MSMEFLLGRTLAQQHHESAAEPLVRHALKKQGWNLDALIEEEPDAGLGNGGLGVWPPASSIRWRPCSTRRSATACATNTAFSSR